MSKYTIGAINQLMVKREAPFGVYLEAGTGSTGDDILLPTGSMVLSDGAALTLGDEVSVFIYRDSEDRIIATMNPPLITLGEVRLLEVVGGNASGAFVSIGLERDVFVPNKEQKYPLEKGRRYLFKLYVDKTQRLAATVDVYGALPLPVPGQFSTGQMVEARIVGRQQNGALQAAIDDQWKAVLFASEYFEDVQPGDVLPAKILKFLDDGKPSLTLRKDLKSERLDLKGEILTALKQAGGTIPYNDRSTPDEIRARFKTSKNYFKMALGNLMKEGKIRQDEAGTHLLQPPVQEGPKA
ncbi:hypothetical protein ABB02_01615 [Clostridiaceae bacterium JG1575]|nr:hypothetical protein ABB02_01615 [Clostridiaceae bacterium JG1575]